jgi:protein translocase SecG subunit
MIWFFYSLQVFLMISTIVLIILQKGSDGGASPGGVNSKMFGIRGRSNSIARLTYVFVGAFFINTIVLCVLYNRTYESELVQDGTEVINSAGSEKKI